MLGWYVFNNFGEIYCQALNEKEALKISKKIDGYIKYINVF